MRRRSLPKGPVGSAELRARRAGTCPVWMLEDFYTEHWDFDTLCSEFGCEECVADPEDMGPTEPPAPATGDAREEPPF